MSKKIVFLADSISTQKAGIHIYGRQLIKSIILRFPNYIYYSISSSAIEIEHLEQIIIPIKSYLPSHLRIRQLTSIPAAVRRLKPDVVIELAHFGPFNLTASIKRITVIHDLSAITHPEFHSYASHQVQKKTMPGIIRKATTIITNSHFTKSEIIRLYQTPEDKIQVLYPLVRNLSAPIKNSRNLSTRYFLCVGTIEPRKNYLTVIKAFEKIHKLNPDYTLIIAGRSGWKNKDLYDYLDNSNARASIELTGYATESKLSSLYEQAFAFISASHFEGFGIPILEASVYGLPLIIAKNSAQYEIAGPAALFFDSSDSEELSAQMLSLIKDEDMRTNLKRKSSALRQDLSDAHDKQLANLNLAFD